MTPSAALDAEERQLFAKYSACLKLWARRFNSAEIAAIVKIPEHQVCRYLWHWRELSRLETAR